MLKDQLPKTSGWYSVVSQNKWFFRTEKFSGLSRNGPQVKDRRMWKLEEKGARKKKGISKGTCLPIVLRVPKSSKSAEENRPGAKEQNKGVTLKKEKKLSVMMI